MTDSKHCGQMEHSNSDYGENLYICWGSSSCASAKGVMTGWCECSKSIKMNTSNYVVATQMTQMGSIYKTAVARFLSCFASLRLRRTTV